MSGLLTSLGLFHPVGPIMMLAPMWMALTKAHWDRPIWAQEGGGELAVVDMAAATALAARDPGRFSLDRLFGIRLPRSLVALALVASVVGIVAGSTLPRPSEETASGTQPVAAESSGEQSRH